MPGTLYIVATPIGNPEDIGARALRVLREADWVVCEELREGERLLKRYGVERPLVDLNEHNERARTAELIEVLRQGKSLALVSDAGTPLFYDPGRLLVEKAYRAGARVTAVPGPSSLMAALVVSGLPIDRFHFVGMLPAKREARKQALRALRRETATVVLLDAPYRLQAVLTDLVEVLGPARQTVVACDMTMPGEQIVRGGAGEVLETFRRRPFKGEFVILVAGETR